MSNARNLANLLNSSGVLTADAGVKADNITIDGTEIDLSSGDLTLDVSGDIILDVDGGDVHFQDSGQSNRFMSIKNSSGTAIFSNPFADGDITFQGNDNGVGAVNPLTLDMSTGGDALFAKGIFLNGETAAANKLDDYEEGAWVPVFQNSGSTAYNTQLGKYVKVGNMVVATFHIDIHSNNQIGSNQLKIDNLPFTVANSSNQYGNVGGLHCNAWSTTTKPDNGLAIPNTTRLEFYRGEGVTNFSNPSGNDIGNGNLLGHVIFFTD